MAAPASTLSPGLHVSQEGKLQGEAKRQANRERAAAVQAAELAQVRDTEADAYRECKGRMLGRPSSYTDDQGAFICAWVAQGRSLAAWCRQSGIPMETVYRWLRARADFREMYAQAHEDRADTLADEAQAIADQAADQPSIEGVAAAKLRVETRKWIAAKLRPGKWGERQQIEHTGGVSIRIGIPQKPTPAAEVIDMNSDSLQLTAEKS